MANNRLYIRCKVCGELFYIGKSFGDGYATPYYPPELLDKNMNEFFEKHTFCHRGKLFEKISCDGLYEIAYEHKENEYMREIKEWE